MSRPSIRIGLLAAALLIAPATDAPAADRADRELLGDYRPLLRYDAAEAAFAQPASIRARRRAADVVYGRVAAEGGERWLQYWLFYASNDQDRGIFRTGRHEGDWEFVQLRLGPAGRPERATYAQHSGAESCPYDEVETEWIGGVEVPVVHVANGSHASYPRPGTADRPWPDPNDEADGSGREVRPRLVAIGPDDPSWVDYPGRWGASEAGWIPGEQSSPLGPRFKGDRRWFEPARYDAEVGRECGVGSPGRPLQTAATAGLAAALALGVALVVRRRRRR